MFRTLDDFDPRGKRILVRTDLNVPTKDGEITDTTRIDRSAITIRELSKRGGRVIIITHFGRPKGVEEKYSQKLLLKPLIKAVNHQITWADNVIGSKTIMEVNKLKDGDIILLENVRFHLEEEKNDPIFARQLADLGQIYVNDAFSTSHRAHASTEAIARLLPAYAGRLMQSELVALSKALDHPEKPVVAIVGGAKISTKLDLLGNLVNRVDFLIIGGGMANTFLFAQGKAVGKSLCERDMSSIALSIIEKSKIANCRIILPIDVVISSQLAEHSEYTVVSVDRVPDDMLILDAGPESVKIMIDCLRKCKTLVWNGPLGAFEIKPFDVTTNSLAQIAAELTKKVNLLTVAGGGDTVSALINAGVINDFSYISTAGGAFLEWLEGKTLPGVLALELTNHVTANNKIK
jgi:phosphoglycerate kinase